MLISSILLGLSIPFVAPRVTVNFMVTDDSDVPIENARIFTRTADSIFETMTDRESQQVRRLTDKQGKCKTRLAVYGISFDWVAEADGYYPEHEWMVSFKSYDGPFMTVQVESSTIDVRVRMRRIKNPRPMVEEVYWVIPLGNTSGVWRVDVVRGELMPPYGTGRHADIEIEKKHTEINGKNRPYGTVRFLDENCGVYKLKMKNFKFPTEYEADPCADYKSLITVSPFIYGKPTSGKDTPTSLEAPENDEYFVYRIRVRKDGEQIASAIYGKIHGAMSMHEDGLGASHWYLSPRVNDTNLEDDPKRNIKIEDYRRQLDEAEKAKK